jgi:hypothetical protein
MALIGRNFYRASVIILIEQANIPSPTDDEHGADWWNENFGKAIQWGFKKKLEELKTKVENMPDDELTKEVVINEIREMTVPVVSVKDYPPTWWKEEFGLKIKEAMAKELTSLIENIQRMRGG